MTDEQANVEIIRDVNMRLRALVESETLSSGFWVGGLVRKHYLSDYGHIYFDLVDGDYSIYCMVREAVRGKLDFTISNGMDIELFGSIHVYEKRARIEMEVQQARLVTRPVSNVHDISVLEQLKKKALWPRERRPIPQPINKIALITSRYSDAERDFNATYRQKGGTAAVTTVDVRIQGQQAPREIADAINLLNKDSSADVIVLTRGGGRLADIAVFDDLLIVEAICRSTIPIVTGIGHQPDTTLADRVADVSQITPTAAAQYLAELSVKQRTVPDVVASTPSENHRSLSTFGKLAIILILVFVVVAMSAFSMSPR
jgi:exodeoxyribonuclease VII large subunit